VVTKMDWPITKSTYLTGFKKAIQGNRKGPIRRNKIPGLNSGVDDDEYEWIEIEVSVRPMVFCKIWENKEYWFYSRDMIKNKVLFEFWMRGYWPASQKVLYDLLRETYLIIILRSDSETAKEGIIERWRPFTPDIIGEGRA